MLRNKYEGNIDTNRPTNRALGLRTGNFAYQQNVRLANMTLDLRTGHFTYEQVTCLQRHLTTNVYQTWAYRLMQKHTYRWKSKEGHYFNGKVKTDKSSVPFNPGKYGCTCLTKRGTGLSSNKRPEQVATRVNPAPHPYTAAATQSTRTRGLDHYKVLR